MFNFRMKSERGAKRRKKFNSIIFHISSLYIRTQELEIQKKDSRYKRDFYGKRIIYIFIKKMKKNLSILKKNLPFLNQMTGCPTKNVNSWI